MDFCFQNKCLMHVFSISNRDIEKRFPMRLCSISYIMIALVYRSPYFIFATLKIFQNPNLFFLKDDHILCITGRQIKVKNGIF